MASKSLGTLTVDLLARTGGFERGMDAAERKSKKTARSIERQQQKLADNLQQIYKKIAIAATAAFVGAAVGVRKLVDANEQLYQSAKRAQGLNVSFKFLQGLNEQASDLGVNVKQVAVVFGTLNRQLATAQRGSATAKGMFAEFGIDPSKIKNTEQAFLAIADSVAKYGLNAKRAGILTQIFGASGKDIVPILAQGAAAIRSQNDAMVKSGQIISSRNLPQVVALYNATDDLGDAFTTLRNTLIIALAPALVEVSHRVTSMVQSFTTKGSAIRTFGNAIADVVEHLGDFALIAGTWFGAAKGRQLIGWFTRLTASATAFKTAQRAVDKALLEHGAAAGLVMQDATGYTKKLGAAAAAARTTEAGIRGASRASIIWGGVLRSLGGAPVLAITAVAVAVVGAVSWYEKYTSGSKALATSTRDLTAALKTLHTTTGQARVDARDIAIEDTKAAMAAQLRVKAEIDKLEAISASAHAAASSPSVFGAGAGAGGFEAAAQTIDKRLAVLKKQFEKSRLAISDMLKELLKPGVTDDGSHDPVFTPPKAAPIPDVGLVAAKAQAAFTKKLNQDNAVALKQYIDQQHAAVAAVAEYGTGTQQAAAKQALFNEQVRIMSQDMLPQLRKMGLSAAQAMDVIQERAQAMLGGVKDSFKQMDAASQQLSWNMQYAFQSFVGSFSDGIANMLEGGKLGFKSILRDFLKMVDRMIIQWLILKAIMAIGGAMGGTPTGTNFASFLSRGGQMAPAGRAVGGPVAGGTTYLVGERGPELFTPSSAGHITPNNQLHGGSAGGITYNMAITVNNDGGQDNNDVSVARQLGKLIEGQTKATLARALQPGGILWKARNGVTA